MEIKTILVDDEILAMRLFELECARFEDIRIIAKFESPVKAIAYAEEHDVDMAILDIEMPEMNGIELGKELRKRRKDIILIFITAHTQYAMDAYQIHAPVYLEKHSSAILSIMEAVMVRNICCSCIKIRCLRAACWKAGMN